MAHNVAEVHVVLVCRKGDAAQMQLSLKELIKNEGTYLPDYLGLEFEIKNVTSHKAMKVGDLALRELANDGVD